MNSLKVLLFSMTLLISQAAFSGECKTNEPTEDLLTDAKKMAELNEAYISLFADQYQEITGKELKIVIVGRAGQDLSDQTVLKESVNGRMISFEDIKAAAMADPDSYNDSSGNKVYDFNLFKDVIRNKFGDKKRSLEFSHLGFLIRNHPKAKKPASGNAPWWWTRHMLRPCENKNAKTAEEIMMQKDLNRPWLHDEGPINFFADDPHLLKARILVPTPELQDRLLEAVLDDELAYNLNSNYYNAAANWKSQKESNSNQWVLEMLAAATRPRSQVQNRKEAQDVLEAMNYRPSPMLFAGKSAMANLWGARLVAPYVTYHSAEQPYYFSTNMGTVISALSVEEFMARNNILMRAFTVHGPEKTAVLRSREEKVKKP
jgi:hypothetical protein